MNGRAPTKREKLFIKAAINIGCIACIIDGREIENPEIWTEFHHDPDFGSTEPACHFHGLGLCVPHHRGTPPAGMQLPEDTAVRHSPMSYKGPNFATKYGTDEELNAMVWERLPQSVKDELGFDISLGEVPPEERRK